MMHQQWDYLADEAFAEFAMKYPEPLATAVFRHLQGNGGFSSPPLKVRDAIVSGLINAQFRRGLAKHGINTHK